MSTPFWAWSPETREIDRRIPRPAGYGVVLTRRRSRGANGRIYQGAKPGLLASSAREALDE
jgi:hypothetical protein